MTAHPAPPDPGTPRPVRPQNDLSPEATVARSLRTQQRAYHHRLHPIPFPTTASQGNGDVLGTRHSRRPNWSAFHPRAPPQTPAPTHNLGGHHGLGVALDHPTPPGGDGGQCSLERRGSSRTFRYGYLVTTSSQSPIPPSTAPSHKGLGHRLRALPPFVPCGAVVTRPGNVFTAALLICDY